MIGGPPRHRGRKSLVEYRPAGVIAAIVSSNGRLFTTLQTVVPALMAGRTTCTVELGGKSVALLPDEGDIGQLVGAVLATASATTATSATR